MEDFLIFKQMMITRQRQLHLATLKALEKAERKRRIQERIHNKERTDTLLKQQGEEKQLDLAIKLSSKITDRDFRRKQHDEDEEAKQLNDAVEASKEAEEMRIARLRAEEAELQEAILLSIKFEQERLEHLRLKELASHSTATTPTANASSEPDIAAELKALEKTVRTPVIRVKGPVIRLDLSAPKKSVVSEEKNTIDRAEVIQKQRMELVAARTAERNEAVATTTTEEKQPDLEPKRSETQSLDEMFAKKMNMNQDCGPFIPSEMLEKIRAQMDQLKHVREQLQ
jgi:hypothetical protein